MYRSILAVFFLSTVCYTLAIPVAEEMTIVQISETIMPVDTKLSAPINQTKEKLRQDGDDGDDGAEIGIEQVGSQVATIISGTLGGNLDTILKGAGGFITEEETQTGVGNIFTSVARPFNQLLVTGVQAGQKFFGITSPPEILVAPISTTTKAPLVRPAPASNGAVALVDPNYQSPVRQPVRQQQQVRATEAPRPLNPEVQKTTDNDNDDDEAETDAKYRKIVKN